jgi:preprotein translocase SecE subunit
MARDRKRAKQRQRRAAQRQPQPARGGRAARDREPEREPEAKIDPDRTIPDLEHGSAGADIAKASIAAGSVDADEVSEELDAEVGEHPKTGEIFADEIADDGYDSEEAEAAVEGAEGVAAARAATGRPSRERKRERGGGSRLGNFLRNSWEELKRVQWPDRRQVAQATAVVIGFVIIIGAYLGAADFVFSKLVDAII